MNGQVVGAQPLALVQWKRDVEVPRLVRTNPAAVQLCTAILAGKEVQLPEVFMSEAIRRADLYAGRRSGRPTSTCWTCCPVFLRLLRR